MAQNQVFIICGEASGDLHAATLAKKIIELNPHIKISGVGGAGLRAAGADIYYDIKDLSVLGFFDALKKLPVFLRLKKMLLEIIREEKPAAVIFVDFSGFNLRLAKSLNNTVPAIYYISPQVWASRKGRVETIRKYIAKMIVFFKFEEEFYLKYGIKAELVGHPLLDIVGPTQDKETFRRQLKLCGSSPTIALLPGSRTQEIKKILPVMLGTCSLIQKEKPDTQFIVAKSNQIDLTLYQELISQSRIEVKIIDNLAYDCLNIADFCLVASGTATLETAIMQKPFVIIYKMSLLNYLLYRPLVKLPYIGMVNIVASKKVVPEYIQYGADPAIIAGKILELLDDPQALDTMKKELAQVRSLLGEKGATLRAARIITEFLKKSFKNSTPP